MKNFIIGAIIGALVVAGIALVVGKQSVQPLGAEGDTNLTNLILDGDLTVGDDAIISGGSLSLTTSNTATSSVSVGCIQTTATSTLTPVKLLIGSSGATTTYANASLSNGLVAWAYGTCP
jgi:hypothetical protein